MSFHIKICLALMAAVILVFGIDGIALNRSPPVAKVLEYMSLITEHCRSRHSMEKETYNECFKAEREKLHYNGFHIIGECNDLVKSEKTDVDLICAHLGDTIHYNFFECIVNLIMNDTNSDGTEALANSRNSIEKCMRKAFPEK